MSKFYTVTAFMLSETHPKKLAQEIREKQAIHLIINLNDVYPITVNTPFDTDSITKNIGPFLEHLLYGNFNIRSIKLIPADDSNFTNRALSRPSILDRAINGLLGSLFTALFSIIALLIPRLILNFFFKGHTSHIDIVMAAFLATTTTAGGIRGALRGNGPSEKCCEFNDAILDCIHEKETALMAVSGIDLDKFSGNAYVTELDRRQQKLALATRLKTDVSSSGDYNAHNQLEVPANTVSFVQSKEKNHALVSAPPPQYPATGYTYN